MEQGRNGGLALERGLVRAQRHAGDFSGRGGKSVPSRTGLTIYMSVDMYRRNDLRVTVTGSCGSSAGFECSGTLSISGTHDLLGAKPKGSR